MRLPRATLWLVLAALVALPACADEPAQASNAAVHYWCAAAVMKRPANDQEEKVVDYIEEWSGLPPKLFIERRDAVNFLSYDLAGDGAMYFLHIGAECPQCDFNTDRLCGDRPPIGQLGLFRRLARRTMAAATVLEGQGDFLRAAQLCADALQFCAHLCQCPDNFYDQNGRGMLSLGMRQMGDFLVNKPGPEALSALMVRLNRIPPNPMSFSRHLTHLAKYLPALTALGNKGLRLVTDKDLDDALSAIQEQRKSATLLRPHIENVVQTLRSQKPEDRAGLVDRWIKQIEDEMHALAIASVGPMTESEPRVRAWAERMRRLSNPDAKQGQPGNPLLQEVAEMVEANYRNFAATNARLEMGRILCAAALFETETGKYPASLDALAKYFPAGLPKDPFTGKDFPYALEEGLPCVTAQPSASLREELKSWDCRMSMAKILSDQAKSVERYRKELQSPAAGAQN